ncbi:MAG: cobaltochelatase subunit CobN, partial [Rhodospirillales bacterium]|nr:cobaltochelatase subunit CobN [Rhodospirillales bacterium]
MHLLAAQPGVIADGTEAVDLDQSPGDIVVLSAADSEIALLAQARRRLVAAHGPGFPSLRLANLMRLSHNLSVDLYVEKTVARARLIIVRLLGGRGYWPYGVDRIVAACRASGAPVALIPGDDHPDAELADLSTLPAADTHRLWQYLVHGGTANAAEFLRLAAGTVGFDVAWREPAPILRAGLYGPGRAAPTLDELRRTWRTDAPAVGVILYRALVQSGDTAAIDALIAALAARGLNPLPIFAASLKDPVAAATAGALFDAAPPDVIVNLTGFALAGTTDDPLAAADCPVLQAVLAGSSEAAWRAGTRGIGPRDLAMNVALPELDGRILSRAVAFKDALGRDADCETDLVGYRPVADRIDFVADLAAGWARLRRTEPAERRVALILANYPNRDGRIANGVGLDTPASAANILQALAAAGYRIEDAPADGAALMQAILAGPTNDFRRLDERAGGERLSLIAYSAFFAGLPPAVQAKIVERWGPPEGDPAYRPGELDCGAFHIAALRFGNVALGVQPARGYNIDPTSSYHDPALVPPHSYIAFYAWLRQEFGAHAIVHVGKHGNLEWLPGKSLALSAECFPEAALGPLPHLYPFIVNDPGEGTQAKRRAAAVIVDHLTPPLTRAGSYGPLAALERLIDEYYDAAGQDPRRLRPLATEIRELAAASGIDRDCGIDAGEPESAALVKLDGFLCELKEMQIRDGLHVFGASPAGDLLRDLLVAIARAPRGDGEGANASLLRAL